nr:unnamed protein product [Callosobruchus analis]
MRGRCLEECYTNRLFCNKIWQATKFTRMAFSGVLAEQELKEVSFPGLDLMDKWILSRISVMVDEVDSGLRSYNFHVCTTALKNFLYYNFCDIYLESTKRGLRQPRSIRAAGHCNTLSKCLDISLRALAPFMPFLAQHLHQRLPKLTFYDGDLERNVEKVLEIVIAFISTVRGHFYLTTWIPFKILLDVTN